MCKRKLVAFAIAMIAPVAAQATEVPTRSTEALDEFDAEVSAARSSMMTDPALALQYATRAETLASTATRDQSAIARATALWLKAEALSRLNRDQEARPLLDRAMMLVSKFPPVKIQGDLLMTRAASAGVRGDVQSALRDLQQAHGIFRVTGEPRSQSLALHDIGSIYAEAGDYTRALRYYHQSAEAFSSDPGLSLPLYNNLGTAYREMGEPRQAAAALRKALSIARTEGSPHLEARILTNLASALREAGALQAADEALDRALAITHRVDSDGWRPFIWGVKAQVAFDRDNTAVASALLDRTFSGQSLERTEMPYREFHETAYRLHNRLGNNAEALRHLVAFKRLDDEAREVMASTNAALIGAQFDFANQELKITKLSAEKLRRDVQLAQSKERLSTWRFWALLVAFLVAVAAALGTALAFLSIRRSRNEVRLANQDLSQSNRQLEKALTAKTRFLATTSHEIRTPLNGILGMTQIMLRDDSLALDHRDRVRIVHEAGTTMRALVDDILDVAKIETGKLSIECARVELRMLMEEVARLWTGQAATKGLAMGLELASCPSAVIGDERRIRQIVFNLMSNAVKFTEKGHISLAVWSEGGELAIRVADTGIGIPPEQLDDIFKSFHQVDGDLTRKYGGTGLGLAICRELVEAMGGIVAVESTLGVGSVFIVRVPVEILPESSELGTAPWPLHLQEARVLIVENNPLTRSIITAAVRSEVGVVQSVGGQGSLATVAKRSHDLAIVDLGSLGDEAACRLWITEATSPGVGLSLILLVAGALPSALADVCAGPRVRILERPVTAPHLLSALRSIHAARSDQKDDVAVAAA